MADMTPAAGGSHDTPFQGTTSAHSINLLGSAARMTMIVINVVFFLMAGCSVGLLVATAVDSGGDNVLASVNSCGDVPSGAKVELRQSIESANTYQWVAFGLLVAALAFWAIRVLFANMVDIIGGFPLVGWIAHFFRNMQNHEWGGIVVWDTTFHGSYHTHTRDGTKHHGEPEDTQELPAYIGWATFIWNFLLHSCMRVAILLSGMAFGLSVDNYGLPAMAQVFTSCTFADTSSEEGMLIGVVILLCLSSVLLTIEPHIIKTMSHA
jgi:hypothetical protein